MERQIIRINNIKCKPNDGLDVIRKKISKLLMLSKDDFVFEIAKRSIDSRHKPDIMYIYSVNVLEVSKKSLESVMKKVKDKSVLLTKKVYYELDDYKKGKIELTEEERPVIIGFGPAGLFAALNLSRLGLRPIVYERGLEISKRQEKVNTFWNGGALDTNCNVQFGEGGAGTFSDGKLNTQIHETTGRISYVLKTFVEHGASDEILYVNKPHIGTDVLAKVIVSIRQEIIANGGEIFFGTKLEKINLVKNEEAREVDSIELRDLSTGKIFTKNAKRVVLAIGHSARDTFEMINDLGICMEPKPFAVGVRVEHKQELINYNSYGEAVNNPKYNLPTADYKVTYQSTCTGTKRGVYSFCMCPGGYVVNASSEENALAVNGMSYSSRAGENANSAIIVTVTPDDFGEGVLSGVAFQRKLEGAAYRAGNGKIPVQLFEDFCNGVKSTSFGKVTPNTKGETNMADLKEVLPEYLSDCLAEGIHGFNRYIKGFDDGDTLLLGVESRTSSPVRIIRNENLYSINAKGLYPCGEGAGYAGGITSASVDGIKVCEAIAKELLN